MKKLGAALAFVALTSCGVQDEMDNGQAWELGENGDVSRKCVLETQSELYDMAARLLVDAINIGDMKYNDTDAVRGLGVGDRLVFTRRFCSSDPNLTPVFTWHIPENLDCQPTDQTERQLACEVVSVGLGAVYYNASVVSNGAQDHDSNLIYVESK